MYDVSVSGAAQGASRPLSENDRKCKRFDGTLHSRMKEAVTAEDWKKITDDLVKASAIPYTDANGLRNNVKNRFLEECPEPDFRKLLNQALMPKSSSAAFHQAQQERASKRQAQDAKRKANRDARLAAQPQRGASSGGGQRPGKQKGGMKN